MIRVALSDEALAFKDDRDILVEKYMWLVRQIAAKLMKHLGHADFNDLVGDGVFGLLKAIDQFDTSRGVKFETYATPVIRGTILNGLRAMDWVPERKRTKTRELQRAMERFQAIHGREGTDEELAKELQVSAKEVYELVADLGTTYILSLDQPISSGSEDERAVIDTIEDKKTREPAKEFQFEEERTLLKKAIDDLPERESILVKLHYFEGKSFEEIAVELKVSKQRISQVHAKAIKKLRDTLRVGTEQAVGTLLEGAFMF